ASYAISDRGIYFIVFLFLLAGHPIAYNIFEKKGLIETKKFLTKLTRVYLLAGIPAVIGLSIIAKSVVSIFTASKFHSGYIIIPWIAAGAFFMGISNIFSLCLGFYKKMNLLMVCFLIGGILNIGLNLIFVPNFGYMAAAVTTFISYAIVAIFIFIISRKLLVWDFPFQSLVKVLFSSVVMGIFVYILNN
ncbi:MAG: lipopolysaccharide biosynthesis protein, partial [Candidatus Hodarchaeota archaeon]